TAAGSAASAGAQAATRSTRWARPSPRPIVVPSCSAATLATTITPAGESVVTLPARRVGPRVQRTRPARARCRGRGRGRAMVGPPTARCVACHTLRVRPIPVGVPGPSETEGVPAGAPTDLAARLAHAIDRSPVAAAVLLDADLNVTWMSRSAEWVIGAGPEGHTGRTGW